MNSYATIFSFLLIIPLLSIGQNAINLYLNSDNNSSDSRSSIKPCKRSTKSLSWIRDSILLMYPEFLMGPKDDKSENVYLAKYSL